MLHDPLMINTSVDQYKKQFKKWKWSKNIPTQIGRFICQKADQREMEEGKDTEFEFRGQTLTRANIQSWIERNKVASHPQGGRLSTPLFDPGALIEHHRRRDPK